MSTNTTSNSPTVFVYDFPDGITENTSNTCYDNFIKSVQQIIINKIDKRDGDIKEVIEKELGFTVKWENFKEIQLPGVTDTNIVSLHSNSDKKIFIRNDNFLTNGEINFLMLYKLGCLLFQNNDGLTIKENNKIVLEHKEAKLFAMNIIMPEKVFETMNRLYKEDINGLARYFYLPSYLVEEYASHRREQAESN